MPSDQPPAADGLGGQRLGREHHRVARVGGDHRRCRARCRGTSRPTTASDVSASGPKICGIQYDAKPSSAASPGRRHDLVDAAVPRNFAAEDPDAHAAQAIQPSGAPGEDAILHGSRGRGSVGRASPCQGEGRGFESRRPLHSRPHPEARRPPTRRATGHGARRAHRTHRRGHAEPVSETQPQRNGSDVERCRVVGQPIAGARAGVSSPRRAHTRR